MKNRKFYNSYLKNNSELNKEIDLEKKYSKLEKNKKEKKKFKKNNILNFTILEDQENYLENDENKVNSDEKNLTYFEKQNLFFKTTKNMAKKIPYKIAFTQEIEYEDNEIFKSLTSFETKDYDKISPKNKKGIELISDKEKLHDLFTKKIIS